jgi:drug/metabolite transporter (DMT)-like permease
MARMKAVRAESVWAALGGVLAGYVLWLIAISIGDFFTTAGMWGPIVLAVAVVVGLGATLWGRRVRAQGNRTLATFAVALPVLPVLLSLLVVADSYL